MTSKSATYLVAAAVFVSVLLAATIGYLIGNSGGDDSSDATVGAVSSTTEAPNDDTTSTSSTDPPDDTDTTSSTSIKQPVETTTTVVATTTTSAAPAPDNEIRALITHPELAAVSLTYSLYVEPINNGTPQAAFTTLGPAITRDNSPDAWAAGQETSRLWNFEIVDIDQVDASTLDVQVRFQSTQDGRFGRITGETCTTWDITHRLVRSDRGTPPPWLINRSSQNPGSPVSCMASPPDA